MPAPGRQLWNVRPAHRPQRTILDGPPTLLRIRKGHAASKAGLPPRAPLVWLRSPRFFTPTVLRGRGRIFPAPARGTPHPEFESAEARRATHMPHARVLDGQSRSLTGTEPAVYLVHYCCSSPADHATDLPSWSCQPRIRTARKPGTLTSTRTTTKPTLTSIAAVGFPPGIDMVRRRSLRDCSCRRHPTRIVPSACPKWAQTVDIER